MSILASIWCMQEAKESNPYVRLWRGKAWDLSWKTLNK